MRVSRRFGAAFRIGAIVTLLGAVIAATWLGRRPRRHEPVEVGEVASA